MAKIQLINSSNPYKFNGESDKFPIFREEIRIHLEDGILPNHSRKLLLSNFLEGEAKRVAEANMSLTYEGLVELLEERFGNSLAITEAWVTKLTEGPNIPWNDVAALTSLADSVRTASQVLDSFSLKEINSKICLKKIVSRLPVKHLDRWIQVIERKNGRETIEDLSRFLDTQIRRVNHPVYAMPSKPVEFKNYKDKPKQAKSYIVESDPSCSYDQRSSSSGGPKSSESQRVCLYCSNFHAFSKCQNFENLKLDERIKFVQNKGLCFGCLERGHSSKGCLRRLTCERCRKKHPTFLHRDVNEINNFSVNKKDDSGGKNKILENKLNKINKNNTATEKVVADVHTSDFNEIKSKVNSITCSSTMSHILPVRIFPKNNPSHQVVTYALLDDGSDSCFLKESIKLELGIEGISTHLELRTLMSKNIINCDRLNNIIVEGLDTKESIELPYKLYTRPDIPGSYEDIPTPDMIRRYSHLDTIKNKIYPVNKNLEIGLLIGNNCPQALCPLEILRGSGSEPYGIKTALGWGVLGPKFHKDCLENSSKLCAFSTYAENEVKIKEIINPWVSFDFPEINAVSQDVALSVEDQQFIKILNKNISHRSDFHYELPLPFKTENLKLPNNRYLALLRLNNLKTRFLKCDTYKNDYIKFMNNMFDKGHAEPAPKVEPEEGKCWYIPHHGVYHPKKPGKIRVVFDCSATYKGNSLNSNLLSGPDLTGNLVGVIIRFRKELVAFTGDIEGMFHQVFVKEEHRDYLRFLWWKDGDFSSAPQEYRMTVHLFGATSSPGCSNFALKQTAKDNIQDLGEKAADFVLHSYYVDDGCASVGKVQDAKELVKAVREMCARGGFRFHKIISNNLELLESIPESERAINNDTLKELASGTKFSTERVLGLAWDTNLDKFKLKISIPDKKATRRGILSSVCSVFDPLGMVAPYVMKGKDILQDICREFNLSNKHDSWDDEVSDVFKKRWLSWLSSLEKIDNCSINRCFKPIDFGSILKAEVHHFSDASSIGYGQVSYLRLVNSKGQVHCSFVIGKARVRPLKEVTIPRLELTAALLSARMSRFIDKELKWPDLKHVFWTDSKAVLGYINNEVRRFHIFVANRVQEIRELTKVKDWHYVQSKENPADIASRSASAEEIINNIWLTGPKFIWENTESWESPEGPQLLSDNDPEVKHVQVLTTSSVTFFDLPCRLDSYSSWHKAKLSFAIVLRYFNQLRYKDSRINILENPINARELENSEIVIFKSLQSCYFKEDLYRIKQNAPLSKKSYLKSLNPFIDKSGLLRVGGRLRYSDLENRNPIILPKNSHVTSLIVKHCHERIKHQGRSMTQNEIRSRGFWVIGASYHVRKLISQCVICKRVRGRYEEPIMADLPESRVVESKPFTFSAVDCFGPFYVRLGRRQEKRYGVVFTCLASRAITLDVLDSMNTDSFINALRRFISRRGDICELRSDVGTNFIGANEELKRALHEMKTDISKYLTSQSCMFTWKFNCPKASHMNGAVERLIGSVRKVIEVMLIDHPGLLTDDCLRTFLSECESIVNGRPLTVNNLQDPDALAPLTPNHAILLQPRTVLPPPGKFDDPATYVRKRWRRIQHLSEEFWNRWRKEYLSHLQRREKWQDKQRNISSGDIVICQDDQVPRNRWPLAIVEEVIRSSDGNVRKVIIKYGNQKKFERPVAKIILLVPGSIPIEEPEKPKSSV